MYDNMTHTCQVTIAVWDEIPSDVMSYLALGFPLGTPSLSPVMSLTASS